ncbi:MAG TPA: hypothetical protein VF121_08615 [Thermoanaerobaculia bacterium]|nr:hypothetical protein [Thermoanaerobaculia bacterium]
MLPKTIPMPDNRLRLVLEGWASEDGHVRLEDFIRELTSLRAALVELDRSLAGSRESSAYYPIVGLSHGSPSIVEVEERTIPAGVPPRGTIPALSSMLQAIDRPDAAALEAGVLIHVAEMARPVGKSLAAVRLASNGFAFNITQGVRKRVEELLEPGETYSGWLHGMLEAINVHDGANVFRLYPDIGPPKVSCHFPTELLDDAIRSVSKFVEVRGVLERRKLARFPHRMEVVSISILPDESELPKLFDLLGIDKGLTGGLRTEEFIARLRYGEE